MVLGQPEPGSDLKGQAAPPQALGLEQKGGCCGATLSPQLPARSVPKASASREGVTEPREGPKPSREGGETHSKAKKRAQVPRMRKSVR